jgi:hypothetical protein
MSQLERITWVSKFWPLTLRAVIRPITRGKCEIVGRDHPSVRSTRLRFQVPVRMSDHERLLPQKRVRAQRKAGRPGPSPAKLTRRICYDSYGRSRDVDSQHVRVGAASAGPVAQPDRRAEQADFRDTSTPNATAPAVLAIARRLPHERGSQVPQSFFGDARQPTSWGVARPTQGLARQPVRRLSPHQHLAAQSRRSRPPRTLGRWRGVG